MKLKEYLKELNRMVEENPAILEYTVIYSSDDEGNSYAGVYYTPSTGNFEPEEQEFEPDLEPTNAVILN